MLSASNASGSTTADLTFQAVPFSQRLAIRTLRNPWEVQEVQTVDAAGIDQKLAAKIEARLPGRSLLGSRGTLQRTPFGFRLGPYRVEAKLKV